MHFPRQRTFVLYVANSGFEPKTTNAALRIKSHRVWIANVIHVPSLTPVMSAMTFADPAPKYPCEEPLISDQKYHESYCQVIRCKKASAVSMCLCLTSGDMRCAVRHIIAQRGFLANLSACFRIKRQYRASHISAQGPVPQ